MHSVTRIISGGQTGADRGGLDAAILLGLGRGGYAPSGWRAEDGEIPLEYRSFMLQNGSPAYPVRTRANIEASDGTIILSIGPITQDSGSYLTAKMARTLGKPCRHFQMDSEPKLFGHLIHMWLTEHDIRTLNVAGPRESREPGVQRAVCSALVAILAHWPGTEPEPSF